MPENTISYLKKLTFRYFSTFTTFNEMKQEPTCLFMLLKCLVNDPLLNRRAVAFLSVQPEN